MRFKGVTDCSNTEISKTHNDCIKWVNKISDQKSYNLFNSKPMNSSSTSQKLEQTSNNSKTRNISQENGNKRSKIDNVSEHVFKKSGDFLYSMNACFTNKHLDWAQTTKNSKSNKSPLENGNKKSKIDNKSELMFKKSRNFLYFMNTCLVNKHLDGMTSDVQLMFSENFEAFTYNYDQRIPDKQIKQSP